MLAVSAGVDMLGTRCDMGSPAPEEAITDMEYFPFYQYAMTLKNLFPHFLPGLPVTGVEWQADRCPSR